MLSSRSIRNLSGSSASTRYAGRATGASEIVAQSVGSYVPAGAIPIKIAQALGSFGMFSCKKDVMPRDRAIHLFQALLATAQVVVGTMLYFDNRICNTDSHDTLCVTAFYLMLVYHGTLITGWGLSEAMRQQADVSGAGSTTSIEHAPHTHVVGVHPHILQSHEENSRHPIPSTLQQASEHTAVNIEPEAFPTDPEHMRVSSDNSFYSCVSEAPH